MIAGLAVAHGHGVSIDILNGWERDWSGVAGGPTNRMFLVFPVFARKRNLSKQLAINRA